MRRPPTRNGLNASDVISGLQKHIRRGEEEMAMQAAAELLYSENKMLIGWLFNRLEVISHEDIGIADPTAVMFTASTIPQARALVKENKVDRASLYVGNVILILCRAQKTRLGDHFQAACGKPVKLGQAYVVPEYAYDKHTSTGRALGRDLQHFREHSAILFPQATHVPDIYEDRAYEVWQRMADTDTETNSEAGDQDDRMLF
jgi:replication-associated recombination protein RarA